MRELGTLPRWQYLPGMKGEDTPMRKFQHRSCVWKSAGKRLSVVSEKAESLADVPDEVTQYWLQRSQ